MKPAATRKVGEKAHYNLIHGTPIVPKIPAQFSQNLCFCDSKRHIGEAGFWFELCSSDFLPFNNNREFPAKYIRFYLLMPKSLIEALEESA